MNKNAIEEICCYNCYKIGHYQSTCLSPRRHAGSCFLCQQMGHSYQNCPNGVTNISAAITAQGREIVNPEQECRNTNRERGYREREIETYLTGDSSETEQTGQTSVSDRAQRTCVLQRRIIQVLDKRQNKQWILQLAQPVFLFYIHIHRTPTRYESK